MNQLILHDTPLAQWHALISEAEELAAIHLPHEIEGYLVLLLTRFTQYAHLGNNPIATEWMQAQAVTGQSQHMALRDVGDQCLLLTGLFPHRAEKRNVNVSYFVRIGRSAYEVASQLKRLGLTALFSELSEHFVAMMDVLLRCRQQPPELLQPIQAIELWYDTHSQFALHEIVRQIGVGKLVNRF
jgi:hypothetical protein